MTSLPKDDLVVELAPGGQPLDPAGWEWQDITPWLRASEGVTIDYGRRDEGSAVDPTICQLSVDNQDGRFAPHNPLGPWYGQLARNTPLRVRWGGRSEVASGTTSLTGAASQPAPTVDSPSTDGLLLCMWASHYSSGSTSYATPGGMTAGSMTGGGLGDLSVAQSAWQAVSAGATGTRTATLTGTSTAWTAASLVLTGVDAPPVVHEERASFAAFGTTTLTTSTSTPEQGWWLLAVQIAGEDEEAKFIADPASPDADDVWTLVHDNATSVADVPRIKMWMRPVRTSGAQSVTFTRDTSTETNHYRLFVISGPGHVRFTGFVSEWPSHWDQLPKFARTRITANGILRRLRQGAPALRSALYRQIAAGMATSNGLVPTTTLPNQYWPLEDGNGAQRGASEIDRSDLAPAGEVAFGESGGPVGAAAQAVLGQAATLTGKCRTFVPSISSIDMQWTFEACVDLGTTTSPAPKLEATIALSPVGWLQYQYLVLRIEPTAFDLSGRDEDGTVFALSGHTPASNLSGVHHIAVTADNNATGTNITYRIYLDGVEVDEDTYAGENSMPRSVVIRNSTAGDADIGVSHVALWMRGDAAMGDQIADRFEAVVGYDGETASARMTRVCREENVPFIAPSDVAAPTLLMGPQPTGSFLDVLADCEATDGGVLYEDGARLAYRPRYARYNQAPALATGFGDLAGPPELTDDDQQLRNSITAQRSTGSSSTAVDSASVEQLGLYDEAVTVNPQEDADLDRIANWRLHLGMATDLRFPLVQFELAHHDHLIPAWLAFRLGNRLTVDHDFPQLPGVEIDLVGEGWRETFSPHRWVAEVNCTPAQPWEVLEVEHGTRGRVGSAGSSLGTGIDSDDTSLSVASDDLPWIDSTNYAAMFPFDIDIGGEQMIVSAITGTSSPQTFTVTRGVNGVTKSHAAGAAVQVYRRTVVAL